MTRISLVLFVAVSLAACNKPSDEACRKAIANMRMLLGTDSPTSTADIEGDVRRCKGGSTKTAVECAGKATSLDELRACDFMKVPASKGSAATPGSNDPGSAGSAAAGATAPGSAAAGSADTGSAGSGSAGAGDVGSAGSSAGSAGSSAAGSASTGSATK